MTLGGPNSGAYEGMFSVILDGSDPREALIKLSRVINVLKYSGSYEGRAPCSVIP